MSIDIECAYRAYIRAAYMVSCCRPCTNSAMFLAGIYRAKRETEKSYQHGQRPVNRCDSARQPHGFPKPIPVRNNI